jgi:ribosomal protein S18 acetylase RimI-like enzyme
MAAEPVWEISRIEKQHDRANFDCGSAPLNDYIRRFARQNAENDIGRTYVAVMAGEKRVVGYYTISAGSVSFQDLPEAERKALPKYPIPTVHIGRLAVDETAQGKGLGETLLMHALQTAARLADEIGIRAVEVVAKDESAKRFYERYGFKSLLDDTLHLYMSTKVIRSLFVH